MWRNFYVSIAASKDFRERLKKLPDFSKDSKTRSTLRCERPWIRDPDPRAVAPASCCLDFDADGRCDEAAWDDNPAHCEGLDVAFVEGRPPKILCGREPFDIEVEVRNTSASPIRPGEGSVAVNGINPLALGKTEADFVLPMPAVPALGSARVRISGLVYKPDYEPGANWVELGAAVSRRYACKVAQATADAQPSSGPECVTTRRLRRAAPCAAPYARDPRGSGDAACCMDADRNGTCDVEQWASSEVGVEYVDFIFRQDTPPVKVRPGVPFDLSVVVTNHSDLRVVAGSGLVQLLPDPATGVVNGAADLVRPIPAMEPRATAVLTFPGLRHRPGPGTVFDRRHVPPGNLAPILQFRATLCMRGGCARSNYFAIEVADAKAATRR